MKVLLIPALLVAALLASIAAAAQTVNVVGSWKLVSVTSTAADGKRNEAPYGPNPTGALHYSADGRMMLMLSYSGRAKLSGADRVAAPANERAEAFATFISYAGRYSIADGKITHRIEVSSYENWVGTDLVRILRVEGRRLTLLTPPVTVNGGVQTIELTWERVD